MKMKWTRMKRIWISAVRHLVYREAILQTGLCSNQTLWIAYTENTSRQLLGTEWEYSWAPKLHFYYHVLGFTLSINKSIDLLIMFKLFSHIGSVETHYSKLFTGVSLFFMFMLCFYNRCTAANSCIRNVWELRSSNVAASKPDDWHMTY